MDDKDRAEVMWQVFRWAYANDIEVRLFKTRSYGDIEYPTLRFSRNDKHEQVSLWPVTDMTAKLDHIWRKIALKLCVEPLELQISGACKGSEE